MERVRVARIEELPVGRGLRVEAAGERVALLRDEDGVFALGDRCSHAEASLSAGEVFAGTVECPRHGSTFDLRTGQALTLPATQPVPVYRVEVEGSEVFLWVPAAEGRE